MPLESIFQMRITGRIKRNNFPILPFLVLSQLHLSRLEYHGGYVINNDQGIIILFTAKLLKKN